MLTLFSKGGCHLHHTGREEHLSFPVKEDTVSSKVVHCANIFKKMNWRVAGWLSGLALPSTHGLILETRDRVPRQAPCMEPASPSSCVSASLTLSMSVLLLCKITYLISQLH